MNKGLSKIRLFVTCVVLVLCCNTQLIYADTILPSGINMQELEKGVEAYIKENKKVDAAMAMAVISGEDTIYEECFGYEDIENQVVCNPNTVFEWGSLSKLLTWVSVMQLYEEGKIALDEDITHYLPTNTLRKLKFSESITMLDLMNHTAGWQDSIMDVYTNRKKEVISLKDYVTKYEPLQIYKPGEHVAYCNYGVTLAGYIVEIISGESYIDYVNEHIFKPLHMTRTSIDPLRQDNSYVRENLKMVGYKTNGQLVKGRYYAPDYPAAGAAGVIGDVELFIKGLLKAQQGLFKKESTYATLVEPTRYFLDSDYPENAHGLWFDFYKTSSLGHYGNTAQFTAHLSISPETQTGIIIMTNIAHESSCATGLGELVFGVGNKNEETENWKTHQFKPTYVIAKTISKGCCRFYNYFQVYGVKVTDKKHIMLTSPFGNLPCERIDENTYLIADGMLKGYKLYVTTDEEGMVNKLATSTFDIIHYKEQYMIWNHISYILIGCAALMTLIAFAVNIGRYKKEKTLFPIIMGGLSILFYAVVIKQAMTLIATTACSRDIYPFIGFYISYLIVAISYILNRIIKRKIKDNLLSVLSVIAISGFIMYWQMCIPNCIL